MSQNFCEIFYSPIDTKLTPAKVGKKLASLLKKKKINITDFHCGKSNSKGRGQHIQIGSNQVTEVLAEILLFLQNLPCENPPISKVLIDQAGETIYSCLVNEKLIEFSSLKAINEYFELNPSQSPEELFFEENHEHSNLLLVRLKISAKHFRNELEAFSLAYIQKPDDESYQKISALFNQNADNSIEFPHLGKRPGCFSDEAIPRSLTFCAAGGDYLYLGFNAACLSEEAYPHARHGNSTPSVNMISAMSCGKAIKDAKGKLHSNQSDPKLEWYIYCPSSLDYMYVVQEKSPLRLWRG